jgi:transposase-like protein
MRFSPQCCPRAACPSWFTQRFRWRRKGYFRRRCDGRLVQRFVCLECRRFFSIQTFRLDYRLHKPHLHLTLFRDFVSKMTMRQSARTLGCTRRTVAHRLRLLGKHCRAFHAARLEHARSRGGMRGVFQLDELESFEHSRRLQPITVPMLIERSSYFVVHAESAPLAARGRLSPALRAKKDERERKLGKRRSRSVLAVRRTFEMLARVHAANACVELQTDRKKSYVGAARRTLGPLVRHRRYSSKARRDYRNPLFPINHTFAMLRDGISRLVRRSWAASKLRERLELHMWIWIVYRNYVRGITNRARHTTPAMALGIEARRGCVAEILAWNARLRA